MQPSDNNPHSTVITSPTIIIMMLIMSAIMGLFGGLLGGAGFIANGFAP
jgi:hypothetical protein